MRCSVYKSLRQADYYLFVEHDDAFSRVPDGLKQLLGTLEKVLDVDLDRKRIGLSMKSQPGETSAGKPRKAKGKPAPRKRPKPKQKPKNEPFHNPFAEAFGKK